MLEIDREADRPSDAVVGKNITELRGARSQSDIAEGMRSKGFKWSQTTVWELEKGKRSLKYLEAISLAEVLDTNVSFLSEVPDGYRILRDATQAWQDFEDVSDRLLDLLAEFREAKGQISEVRSRIRMRIAEDGSSLDDKLGAVSRRTVLEALEVAAERRGKQAKREMDFIRAQLHIERAVRSSEEDR